MWQTSRTGRLDYLVVYRWRGDGYGPVGDLTFEGSGPRRNGRFRYASSYLGQDGAKAIDPVGLPLVRKSYAAAPEEVPLAFHDAGPDGWGKEILTRAFPTSVLSMPEYLALGGLGRTGDLAFGPTPTSGPVTWTPPEAPLVDLPDESDDLGALMDAAAAVEAGDAEGHHFKLLFRNSDVGGARPKARIRSEGRQWIAKFPTSMDKFDDPRVEAACLDVAEAAGFPVPRRKIVVAGRRAALFVERFDRDEGIEGRPYAYLSAATLLKQASASYATARTYTDIAAVAQAIGVKNAAASVFGRLLLNAYLHNTDDHLRNHAFLDRGDGWTLSPVFDLVPHPDRARHVPAPAPGMSPAWDVEAAMRAHTAFRLDAGEAQAIRERILQAARRLGEFMDAREVPPKDRRYLKDAFPREMGFAP
ncbi:type II toxin-antitoxin system HipA family toxin [Methylobacterium sp. J-067]|uniref:type II toxin-antitoxin system HipA family toxin n=1 Tax=Methylobacterium sp. J-067 TaxID=2836648 RepID=UPI001FB99138|nr:HipA domain-containing protein [Methylobacterium sp. J-067]MCJ2026977.1 HipA domain-containing protein [Methylobacterium sp. J-067]